MDIYHLNDDQRDEFVQTWLDSGYYALDVESSHIPFCAPWTWYDGEQVEGKDMQELVDNYYKEVFELIVLGLDDKCQGLDWTSEDGIHYSEKTEDFIIKAETELEKMLKHAEKFFGVDSKEYKMVYNDLNKI